MENKTSFIVYPSDFLAAVLNFRKNQISDLIVALCQHNNYGKIMIPISQQVRDAFDFLQNRINENNKRYLETCEKRRLAGEKGGRPKKAKDNQKVFENNSPAQNLGTSDDPDKDEEEDKDHIFINKNIMNPEKVKGNKNERRKEEEKTYKKEDEFEAVANISGAPSVADVEKYRVLTKGRITGNEFITKCNQQNWKQKNGKDIRHRWMDVYDSWCSSPLKYGEFETPENARQEEVCVTTDANLKPLSACLAKTMFAIQKGGNHDNN